MFTAKLKPNNVEFTILSSETILEAAIRQNVSFPYRCQVGGCSSCLCQLVEGDIRYGDMAPFLTDDEIAKGWMFACLAFATTDLTIRL